MKYADIIQSILSYNNGAIETLNGVWYQDIRKTVKLYANVNFKTEGAELMKEQMIDLLESLESSKCRLRAVNAKRK